MSEQAIGRDTILNPKLWKGVSCTASLLIIATPYHRFGMKAVIPKMIVILYELERTHLNTSMPLGAVILLCIDAMRLLSLHSEQFCYCSGCAKTVVNIDRQEARSTTPKRRG